ncbi:MAG TPA: hypothetical protein PLR74_00855, partial [Agriterribacter sp.]|nr:hypothetical protein [Agriterribacter sp.]
LGNWKFIELDVAVESGSAFDYGGIPGKIVATYTATTQNNTGLLTVTAGKMKTTDLGYTISAGVKIITYIGGIPVDPQPQEEQLDFEFPPASAICDYRQAGSDSLYFPNGFLFDIPDTNGQQLPGASDPAGARFTITGDILKIQSSVNRSTVVRQGNDDYEVTQKVDGTATFVRQ